MKSSASESKPFQSRSKGEIPGRARRKERLSRSKLKQAFLIDSDSELFMYLIRLMKSSASEPGLTATLSSVQLKSGHYLHDYQMLYGVHVMSQSILVQTQKLTADFSKRIDSVIFLSVKPRAEEK